MVTKEEMGRRLQAARKAAGISQERLARRIGASKETVRRIERGIQETSVFNAAAMAEETGVSLDYLLGINEAARTAPKPSPPSDERETRFGAWFCRQKKSIRLAMMGAAVGALRPELIAGLEAEVSAGKAQERGGTSPGVPPSPETRAQKQKAGKEK